MIKNIILAAICIASISVLTTGCMTTTQKGAGIGAGAGAATGAIIGALAGDPALGAALGAGVGAVGGALVGDHMDDKREEAEKVELQRQLELEKQAGSGQGKNKIDGHYEYIKNSKDKDRVFTKDYIKRDDHRDHDGIDDVLSKADKKKWKGYLEQDPWYKTKPPNSK